MMEPVFDKRGGGERMRKMKVTKYYRPDGTIVILLI